MGIPAEYRYPTVRAGGLFLVVMGVVIVAATLLGGEGLNPVFWPGLGLAILTLIVAKRRFSYGEQTRRQRIAVFGAIGLEMVLLVAVGTLLGGTDPRTLWLWVLLVVGVHFLPFGVVHGPRAVVLGVLCVANALLGLWLAGVPFLVFGLADGLLKVVFGGWMFADRTLPSGQAKEETLTEPSPRAKAH